MKIDYHVWSAQPGNWVWVHTGRRKVAGQISAVRHSATGHDNEYTIQLKDGSQIQALQRELKRCRPPKRIRNADWFEKQETKR